MPSCSLRFIELLLLNHIFTKYKYFNSELVKETHVSAGGIILYYREKLSKLSDVGGRPHE